MPDWRVQRLNRPGRLIAGIPGHHVLAVRLTGSHGLSASAASLSVGVASHLTHSMPGGASGSTGNNRAEQARQAPWRSVAAPRQKNSMTCLYLSGGVGYGSWQVRYACSRYRHNGVIPSESVQAGLPWSHQYPGEHPCRSAIIQGEFEALKRKRI